MIISIASFLGVFTIIVLVHELGHFIAARRSGIKVYEFSIGFPFSPRIVTLFRHRETEFTLRLLPLGGFVSFSKGDENNSIELFEAPRLHRAVILAAGSLANIAFAFLIFIPVFVIGKHLPFVDAVLVSAKTVWSVLSGVVVFFAQLITGNCTMEGLTGPVGIASLAGKAAAKGMLHAMFFTGMLSLSLGILNLLPLPALDGGQLLMLMIESIRRKRLSLRAHQLTNLIGLFLFLALTIVVTYRDITRLLA